MVSQTVVGLRNQLEGEQYAGERIGHPSRIIPSIYTKRVAFKRRQQAVAKRIRHLSFLAVQG